MQKTDYFRTVFITVSMVFTLLFLNLSCEQESINNPLPATQNIKTVSKTAALNYLNSQMVMGRNGSDPYITQMADSIVYDPLINSDELLATVAVSTFHSQANSRVLLLEVNDTLQSVVYSMYSNNNFATEDFNGSAIITDLQGNVKNGFKIENGYYVAQYVFPEDYALYQTASRGGGDGDGNDYVWDLGALDEILLTGTRKIKINVLYCTYCSLSGSGSAPEDEFIDAEWSGPGGSSNTSPDACPDGYVKDENDNCMPEPTFDPCAKIQQQLANANHQAKVEFLKTKTSETIEHGFKQVKTGPFASLPTMNDGHTLDFGNLTNVIGYIHTHTNLYYTGIYDSENNPEFKKGIKMFSPNDLRTFLLLVKNAQQDNDINVGDIYGTVITCSGNYTLKFTGDPNSINTNFNSKALEEKYKKYIKDFGKEKGFLKFIKEVTNNNGVSLYKIEDNGTVKEKYLDENGNKQSEKCD